MHIDHRASGSSDLGMCSTVSVAANTLCTTPQEPSSAALLRARAGCKFVSSTGLATIALLAASTVSTHAQTSDWTGGFSSNWFLSGNWVGGIPQQTRDANINTVTPNSTVVASPGAIARNLSVGPNGTGMLTIQGGVELANSSGTIGNLAGGLGTVTVTEAGSTWSNASSVVVGGQGRGTLIIQDGGTVSSGGGSVGLLAGSNGTVTVTGLGSSWIHGPSGGLNIGSSGTGTLTIANGGRVINATLNAANIGNGAGSQGTVTVTGPGSTWSNSLGLNIGNRGTGTLTIADGGIVNGPVVIATNAGAIGTLNIGAGAGDPAMAPGTITAPRLVFGAGSGTLTFNHTSANYVFAPAISGNGAVNVLAGTTALTAASTYTGGTTISAGILQLGNGGTTGSITGDVANNGTFAVNRSDAFSFGGVISGTGAFQQNGTGITTLTVANTYSGSTNVNAGTLRAGALNRFSPNSAVAVASVGTLDLNGFNQTIAGLTNAGLVNMGTPTALGTVLTTQSYTGNGGTIAINTFLGGDNSPSDRLVIDGGTASGASGLRVTNAGGSGDLTLGNGIPVVVTTNGGTTAPGAFGLSGPVAAGPYEYFLFRGGVTPGNENDLFLRNVAGPIPPELPGPIEPGPIPPGPSSPGPTPPGAAPAPIPFFRPEAIVYAGMPALARLIGKETLGTFHERQGDQSLLAKNGPVPIGWGRAFGERAEYRRGGALSPEFDGHLWGFQAGFDLAAVETWAGRDHFGAFVGHTRANGDVRGFALGQRRTASGSVDLDATSLGLYWTHIGPSGWYLGHRADAFVARWLAALVPRRRNRPQRQQHDRLPRGRLSVLSRARPRARAAGADHLAGRRLRPDAGPVLADWL